ncbi:MAG TPA: TonB-dependent receptor [Allosphingosinicella sp.]|nr:TonB-dependent receptor [Allosphingosinicella sp.]
MTLALGAPAYGQATRPVTEDEAQACLKLPTPAERQACIQAQARPEGIPEEAGDPATQRPGENLERQAETDQIVVTGSRIRRNAFTSPDPLTVIDPELEQKGGRNDTAEILQSSPVASGSFQITPLISAGGFVTNGGVGAQTISLRGLGASRTLTLVNGRRAGPAGTRGAIAGFDLNVIPSAAIQSVDIVKTGASSIYGSDAIAGVVNLLTRKSTDGLDIRGFSTVPLEGGAENYSLSGAYGKEFSRGNFIIGVDYTHRNELERGDRDYLLCPEEFITFRDGTRADIIDPRTGQPRCNASFSNSLAISAVPFPGQPGVTFSTVVFGGGREQFLPGLPTTGATRFPSGFFGLPNCQTLAAIARDPAFCRLGAGLADPINPLIFGSTVQPKLDRYTAFGNGSFELADNIELIGEFLFNRRETESQGFRQLFFTQFSGSGSTSRRPGLVCSPALRATNPNCDPTSPGDPLNAGFVGNFFITPVVGVPSDNSTKVDYYRGVAGLRSNNFFGLLNNWNFDSYVQYSLSDGDYTNGRIFQDAVDLLEFRSRACQPGQVTSIRGVPCQNINFTDPRVIAGNFTDAENEFLFGEETGNTEYTTLTAEASVSGNLFTLPAGDVGVAVGVQFRREEIDDQPGEITRAGNVFGQSVSGRTAGHSTSKEAFAEIEIPILRDQPFFRNLTLNAAGRVVNSFAERREDKKSDRDNGNFTYKLGLNWAVNEWLRLRGTYGTSFRSPALFEQFLAAETSFPSQAIDPCIQFGDKLQQGSITQRVFDRCLALGLDPNRGLGGTSSALSSREGGIGLLEPETSTAKTFGVIFNPTRGPWEGSRFSVAVDYFDIEVEGQVTTLGPANIVSTCFNADDFPNARECSLFVRDLDPNSPRFGQILTVQNPFLNINSQRNRGVDLTARFTQDLGRHGTLSMLGQATIQIEDEFELFEGQISDNNGEIGDPIFVGDVKTTYTTGPWSFFYGVQVVGKQSEEDDLRFARGGDICTPSALRGGDVCPVFELKRQFYHSASITRDLNKRFSMTFGLNNIFDNEPPRGSAAFSTFGVTGQTPTFATQYDLVGRRAFVSFRAKM